MAAVKNISKLMRLFMIAERSPILQSSSNMNYLSFKERLTETSCKFYDRKLYEEYYSFFITLCYQIATL